MSRRPTCATCWHLERFNAPFCRRMPPQLGPDGYAKWPRVSPATDYCAEHFEPAAEEQPG